MKKITTAAFAAVLAFGVAGCTTTEQRAAGGGLAGAGAGALIGGLATGTTRGALTGAAVGGVAGVLIGVATTPGYCRYRDSRGRIYEARCN
jgi:surface antigen